MSYDPITNCAVVKDAKDLGYLATIDALYRHDYNYQFARDSVKLEGIDLTTDKLTIFQLNKGDKVVLTEYRYDPPNAFGGVFLPIEGIIVAFNKSCIYFLIKATKKFYRNFSPIEVCEKEHKCNEHV